MLRVELNRVNGEYGFEAVDAMGHKVKLDTSPDEGGLNFGVRPMQSLLMALGACSGIDVVSILKKQRQPIDGFTIIIEGERHPTEIPALWTNIFVQFKLKGNIEREKAVKACTLSVEKYCSVAATLRHAGAKITWDLQINE